MLNDVIFVLCLYEFWFLVMVTVMMVLVVMMVIMIGYVNKVKESRNRSGVAERVQGGLGSQIS